jgi:hypothetical protein
MFHPYEAMECYTVYSERVTDWIQWSLCCKKSINVTSRRVKQLVFG